MSWAISLFKNVRFYVLVFSVMLSLAIFFWIQSTVEEQTIRTSLLTQTYALFALLFLYLALLAGPLTRVVTTLPFRGKYLKARRAIGVSAFYFSVLHARSAFYDVLGGLPGVLSLEGKFFIAIIASSIALFILLLMAATSFDVMVKKLTFPKWKMLHRFVYLAGMLILFHALTLGSHFQDITSLVPVVVFVGIVILLVLHAIGLSRKYSRK